jgi:hypothetical protein
VIIQNGSKHVDEYIFDFMSMNSFVLWYKNYYLGKFAWYQKYEIMLLETIDENHKDGFPRPVENQ